MKTSFRKSFVRDLKRIKDQRVRGQVRDVIQKVEAATDLGDVSNVKKIVGSEKFYLFASASTELALLSKKTWSTSPAVCRGAICTSTSLDG